jgi:hydrogenase maturation protease
MGAFCDPSVAIDTMKPTIIIGIGNPVLTDDAVGVQISRRLAAETENHRDIDVAELYAGGLSLMEAMVGYDRAILIDAMERGQDPGTVYRMTDRELVETKNSVCAHNTTLTAALQVGRLAGLPLPGCIEIWGIEPQNVTTFGEELTEAVAQAVPRVVEAILKTLTPSERMGA